MGFVFSLGLKLGLKTFFIILVDKLSKEKNVVFETSYDELLNLLKIEFKDSYNPIDLNSLLKNGFEVRDGYFEFRKDDFIRPAAQL